MSFGTSKNLKNPRKLKETQGNPQTPTRTQMYPKPQTFNFVVKEKIIINKNKNANQKYKANAQIVSIAFIALK